MPVMNARQQADFFRTQLGSSLPPLQVREFEADLLHVNLNVMDAALQQVAATARTAGKPPRSARGAVWASCNRSVAEINQLFPVFFIFESAWRAVLSEVLKARYGGSDTWWHPIRAAMHSDGRGITSLEGAQVSNDVVRRVVNMLKRQNAAQLSTLTSSYNLIEASILSDVEWLIERHWSMVASLFSLSLDPRPTSSQFTALFKRVREARNDAYHHRIVSNRQRAVDAAEKLLDLINVHLGSQATAIAAAGPAPFRFNVVRVPRHH